MNDSHCHPHSQSHSHSQSQSQSQSHSHPHSHSHSLPLPHFPHSNHTMSSFSLTFTPSDITLAPTVVIGTSDIGLVGTRTVLHLTPSTNDTSVATFAATHPSQNDPAFTLSTQSSSSSSSLPSLGFTTYSSSQGPLLTVININSIVDESVSSLLASSLVTLLSENGVTKVFLVSGINFKRSNAQVENEQTEFVLELDDAGNVSDSSSLGLDVPIQDALLSAMLSFLSLACIPTQALFTFVNTCNQHSKTESMDQVFKLASFVQENSNGGLLSTLEEDSYVEVLSSQLNEGVVKPEEGFTKFYN
eukprot:TRINITY_DN73_c0_g1_i2.p1 TRINITY_DN73_c0_g1~~TRINITY_DN73_c0_g1_i2.p1  ORF type:complete len:303 (-),score=77.36 TRINITY_DN73_c0_g1_i2:38-946(-)